MGICNEQEIMQLIGTDNNTLRKMATCLMECHNLNIYTQQKALEYLGSKLKVKRYTKSSIRIPQNIIIITFPYLSHLFVDLYRRLVKQRHQRMKLEIY
jgi:DNA-directed RNA polymerase III subunit RPC2